MRVVYIAGPFRAPNAWLVEQNIRRAEEMGFVVSGMGAAVIIPHTNTRFFNGTLTDEHWLAAGLELLRRCDAVMCCKGWECSSGTRAEMAEATRLGMPVFTGLTGLADLRRWLDAPQPPAAGPSDGGEG